MAVCRVKSKPAVTKSCVILVYYHTTKPTQPSPLGSGSRAGFSFRSWFCCSVRYGGLIDTWVHLNQTPTNRVWRNPSVAEVERLVFPFGGIKKSPDITQSQPRHRPGDGAVTNGTGRRRAIPRQLTAVASIRSAPECHLDRDG